MKCYECGGDLHTSVICLNRGTFVPADARTVEENRLRATIAHLSAQLKLAEAERDEAKSAAQAFNEDRTRLSGVIEEAIERVTIWANDEKFPEWYDTDLALADLLSILAKATPMTACARCAATKLTEQHCRVCNWPGEPFTTLNDSKALTVEAETEES